MLPNGNPQNLKLLHEKYEALKQAYYRARDLLQVMGDDASLIVLQPLGDLIEKCHTDMRTLEKMNLEKLDQAKAVGNDNYPYSIIAWYEDEAKDLWDGLK